MKRPDTLKTKIFLDSGNPEETKEALNLLGFLDGQTTNPSLIAKNPEIQKRKENGEKLTTDDVYSFYKGVIQEVRQLIPQGSVSIEVFADQSTQADQMLSEAREMNQWISNAHIKFPTTTEGLKAAEAFVKEGGKVNMTLVFSQDQAAAVHKATEGAMKGNVFLSPFIGRLDDKGENGMDLIKNIQTMYQKDSSHVEILAASIRTIDHLITCLSLQVDIVTVPFSILKEWVNAGQPVPQEEVDYKKDNLDHIPYKLLEHNSWQTYDISHPLTTAGLEKFVSDWNKLLV